MKKPAAAVKATSKKSPRTAPKAPKPLEKVEIPDPPQSAILIDAEMGAHLGPAPSPALAAEAGDGPLAGLPPSAPAPLDPRLMATITCAFCGVPYEGAGRLLLTMVETPDGGHLKLAACHLCAVTEHARVTHMLAPEARAKYLVGAGIIAPG